jgi:hypothetical protein
VSVDSAAVLAADDALDADSAAELAVALPDSVLVPELQPASVALRSRAATPVAETRRVEHVIGQILSVVARIRIDYALPGVPYQ